MKLRIRGNSLRLRLTKSEVAQIAETGAVEDAIEFGGEPSQRLIYALKADDIEKPTAVFAGGRITVRIPKTQAERWTRTNQIGIEAEKSLGENGTLRILIEKDFACLEPRKGEDDADTLAHPFQNETENPIRLKAI